MRDARFTKHRIPAADVPSAREGLEHIYEGGTTEVSAESPTRKGHAQGIFLCIFFVFRWAMGWVSGWCYTS